MKVYLPFYKFLFPFGLIGCLFACGTSDDQADTDRYHIPSPQWPPDSLPAFRLDTLLDRDLYYDKILGSLVGSAIGDAMGAPVEMWPRENIHILLGYIDSMHAVVREGSPEGPWEDNLPEGGTTDDTRWKYLTGGFLLTKQHHQPRLDARSFARYIVARYLEDTEQALTVRSFDPEPLERELRRVTWLQEWAKVARPYADAHLDEYTYALHRFYGGEMACAGMLYAPLIGAYYPGHAERAYTEAYRLGIFDLGYARDITGLTAAMVARAMQPAARLEDITAVTRSVDPLRYFNARLTGRIAHRIQQEAQFIVYEARSLTRKDIPADLVLPRFYKQDSLELTQLQKAYALLDEKLQDIPFHAAEIHLINLTALAFGEGDFQRTLAFVINFGRDNDTVGAVTGAILGAQLGFQQLPPELARRSLEVNREVLGISLEQLAADLTEQLFGPHPGPSFTEGEPESDGL